MGPIPSTRSISMDDRKPKDLGLTDEQAAEILGAPLPSSAAIPDREQHGRGSVNDSTYRIRKMG